MVTVVKLLTGFMKPTGGRGKVASYKSTHVRIPDAIKHRVERLKEQYFDGSLEYTDELIAEDHKLANEYRKLLTSNNQSLDSSQNSLTPLSNEETDEELADEDDEPSDNEVIQTQAKMIQELLTDVKLLERELEQLKAKANLDNAKNLAVEILKNRKSARWSIAKLLSGIYSAEVKPENLK